MSQKITDEYGNTLGKVENKDKNKYVVKDNLGNKVVTAEKEFLGENYEIRNNNGEIIGKTEKEFLGKKTFIKDFSGKRIGTIEPLDESGNLFLFALAAVIMFGYISITSVPEILGSAGEIVAWETEKATYLNPGFFCITLPLIIMGLINVLFIFLKKNLFPSAANFWKKLINEIILGSSLYLASFIIMTVVELINGNKFFETIFIMILGAIIYLFAYLILMIPLAFVLALILKFASRKK